MHIHMDKQKFKLVQTSQDLGNKTLWINKYLDQLLVCGLLSLLTFKKEMKEKGLSLVFSLV